MIAAYVGAGIVALWGTAHIVPTRQIVRGFAPITRDNARILVQEWIAEALTMWTIAGLVITATAVGGDATVTDWVDRICAMALVAIAALTTATGARTPIVWFRICPLVLGSSAALLAVASLA